MRHLALGDNNGLRHSFIFAVNRNFVRTDGQRVLFCVAIVDCVNQFVVDMNLSGEKSNHKRPAEGGNDFATRPGIEFLCIILPQSEFLTLRLRIDKHERAAVIRILEWPQARGHALVVDRRKARNFSLDLRENFLNGDEAVAASAFIRVTGAGRVQECAREHPVALAVAAFDFVGFLFRGAGSHDHAAAIATERGEQVSRPTFGSKGEPGGAAIKHKKHVIDIQLAAPIHSGANRHDLRAHKIAGNGLAELQVAGLAAIVGAVAGVVKHETVTEFQTAADFVAHIAVDQVAVDDLLACHIDGVESSLVEQKLAHVAQIFFHERQLRRQMSIFAHPRE